MIAAYNLPYPLDVSLRLASWRPLAPGVVFYLLVPLFEPLVREKLVCVCDMVLSPYVFRSISSAYDGIFLNRTKNFICSMFIVHSSVLIAEKYDIEV